MSSSPFPILDNRPIDKWKVTELKEELKRRRLTTQGLKVDLVRRLDDALRAEQQESQSLNAAPFANQQAEIAHTGGVSFTTPDRMPATPVALAGSPFGFDTTPSAAQTTPEPTVVKTTADASAGIEITPPPVVSKPEVNAGDHDDVRGVAGLGSSVVDDVKLQEPQDADVRSGAAATDAVSAQEASNEQSVQKSNAEMENKAQPTDSELEIAAACNQVSVTGYEVKSDCISTDSVPTNEKMDNEIAADDVKLEQNVNKSQEPSTVIGGESHPMDVEKPPEQKVSVGGGDVSDAANAADMTKGNNNDVDAGDSEKLNLDRSSGDESMEDEPESKQTESVTSHEVVGECEKSGMLTDVMDAGKGEAPENKSHPLVASDKRKLPGNDQEAVVNNEPVKRQRRWNSGSVKVPEAQATNSVTPTTTPKSTGLKRDFTRSNSSVSEEGPKERVVPPSSKEPTDSLRIDRFLRPFTLKAVQELLGKTGNVTSFWMDSIKTHCYVSYSSVEEAAATREAVYNLQWPPNGGRLLAAEFVGSEEVKAKLEPPLPPPQAKPQPQAAPSRPPTTTLPPPPPLAKAPPVIERVTLPPPPPLVAEEQEPPIVTLDDLFKKTKAIPRIYYLPLSEDQVAAKLAANNNK